MFESHEAAQIKTVTGWVGSDGRFYGDDERAARYGGSTHHQCECGGIAERSYTRCEKCRNKTSYENYLKLPFKEWDMNEPICLYDGEEFFWDEQSLIDYLEENKLNGSDVRLVLCDPIHYQPIDCETVAGDAHEDWEPCAELEQKINDFNKFLETLPPHSWYGGKIRTSYEYDFKKDDE